MGNSSPGGMTIAHCFMVAVLLHCQWFWSAPSLLHQFKCMSPR